MGTDKNGNEFGERMVSGRNAILRRAGIYPGENTRLNLTENRRKRNRKSTVKKKK